MKPVALLSTIHQSEGKARPGSREWPVRLRVVVQRDQDGDVTLLWNDGKPQTGRLSGEIERISFTLHKGVAGAMGTIRVDNVSIRRFVDDDSRPTTTLDVEESRP